MNVEAQNFKLEMSYGELWSLAYDVERGIKHTLRTHWVNHQNKWKENEKPALDRLRVFFTCLGRPELADNIYLAADDIFREFNQNKKP